MAKEIGRLLTAMITPFKADGSIDFGAAERLANLLVADGSDGVVVSGTTGESPTLSDDEKVELVGVVKKAIPNHNVVAGTGSNDTHHSIKLSGAKSRDRRVQDNDRLQRGQCSRSAISLAPALCRAPHRPRQDREPSAAWLSV